MIAKVNGTAISAADVEKEMEAIMAQYQQNVTQEQLQQMIPEIKKQAIESIINRILLHEEVARQNIVPSPDRVAQEIQKISSRFPSQQAFEERLTQLNLTLDQMEKDLEQQFKVDTLIRGYVSSKKISVTDEDASKFYEGNPDAFKAPEQVRTRHILLQTKPEDSDESKSEKRLQLAGLQGQIAKGADFADLAQKHSTCPSKEKGGDLGFFPKGKMVQPFEDAAFSMKQGEVSDIVETQFGFHLIKLEEKKESFTEQYDDVKEKIVNHLIANKEQEAFGEYVKGLRSNASIEYTDND